MSSLAAATSTHGGSDESAEHKAARLVHEAETALHDAGEPGVDAWIASAAEHPGDRASRAGCQIQQAHQHQRFMRMIYRTYGKLLGLLFLIVNSTIGKPVVPLRIGVGGSRSYSARC